MRTGVSVALCRDRTAIAGTAGISRVGRMTTWPERGTLIGPARSQRADRGFVAGRDPSTGAERSSVPAAAIRGASPAYWRAVRTSARTSRPTNRPRRGIPAEEGSGDVMAEHPLRGIIEGPDDRGLLERDADDLGSLDVEPDRIGPLQFEPAEDLVRADGKEHDRPEFRLEALAHPLVGLHGRVGLAPEHLPEELRIRVDRRHVEHGRLGTRLGGEGEGDLLHMDQEVDGVGGVGPLWLVDHPDGPDLSDAVSHASRLDPHLDRRIAEDALLRDPGAVVVHDPLVGTRPDAFPVPAAALLVDEDEAVLLAFVDRLPRARRDARRVRAVHADPREIEVPDRVGDAQVVVRGLEDRVRLVLTAIWIGPVDVLRAPALHAFPRGGVLENRPAPKGRRGRA